jgi:NADH-quinone oxidoreductase subunit J
VGVLLFALVACLALAGGVGVIASRRPVYSALALLVVLGSLAVDYLLLDAQFVAALQVIIYAGAIVVLFVFIIMLLHVQSGEDPRTVAVLRPVAGALLCAAVGLTILVVVVRGTGPAASVDASFGTVQAVGRALFSRYLLPFEAASVLLLVGMIGAVALGRRLPPAAGAAGPDRPAAD